MLHKTLASFVLVISLCPGVFVQAADKTPGFRAGAAVVDIVPREFPISMLGSFSDRQATSAHDPLEVRAIVLDDGRMRIAIAVCDNCIIPRELIDEAKKLAVERTQIAAERMLIAATHTHTAPAVVVLSKIPVDARYTKLLVDKIAEAIAGAELRLAPARAGWAVVPVADQVFNRRWFLKEGTMQPNPFGKVDRVRMNPSAGSLDLVRPAGPTDPDVSVLSLQGSQGEPLALLANYSLHYVGGVPARQLSADYFGEFTRQIHQRLAPDAQPGQFVGILSNGTSGDINNVNFREPRQRREPFEQIRAVAKSVTDAAEQAYRRIDHRPQITLAMAQREIELAVRKPDQEELAAARAIVAKPNDEGLPRLARYYAESAIRLREYPDTVKVQLQALRIGRLGVVAVPCEVFAEIGLEIKRLSPLQPTFTIELANGYNGYLPSPEQHALGGYETWRTTSSYLEENASRKIVATLKELLAEVSSSVPVSDAVSSTPRLDPPNYRIKRASSKITIDGKLDEPAWQPASGMGPFSFTWWQGGKQESTLAKMLWDDENLYIGHQCFDEHILARATAHDDPVSEDDCFEIMLAPNPERPDFYFNIEWNVRGAYIDGHRTHGPKKPSVPWDVTGIQIAGTHLGTLDNDEDHDESWTCEIAIPLKNFQKHMKSFPPRPGDRWNLNLNRHNYYRADATTKLQYSQWSSGDTPKPSFHTPHRFGQVILVEEP